MQHANGSQSIADVIICVEDVEAVAARYAAVAGKEIKGDAKVRRIELGCSDILVTLHHHFPTKADLVVAVANELKLRFQSEKAPNTAAAPIRLSPRWNVSSPTLITTGKNIRNCLPFTGSSLPKHHAIQ